MLVLAAGDGVADSQETGAPKNAADVAAAVADISAAIVLQSVASHDNSVDVKYRATASRLFPHNKSERDKRQIGLTLQFCSKPGIALGLRNGVAIHQILFPPDNGDPFEFSIDQSACDKILDLAEANKREHFERGQPSSSEPKKVPTVTVRPNRPE